VTTYFRWDDRATLFLTEALMKSAILVLFKFIPLIMGLGFLAPLIAQILVFFDIPTIMGIPAIFVGIAIGGLWGGVATKTGRWI
jgi:hypothetical protein